MREKRKALSTGKQLRKGEAIAKITGGCENSVLTPIKKWKSIVLENEKTIVQVQCGAERGKELRYNVV